MEIIMIVKAKIIHFRLNFIGFYQDLCYAN